MSRFEFWTDTPDDTGRVQLTESFWMDSCCSPCLGCGEHLLLSDREWHNDINAQWCFRCKARKESQTAVKS